MAIGDIWQYTLLSRFGSSEGRNVFYYIQEFAEDTPALDAQSLGFAFENKFFANAGAAFRSDLFSDQVQWYGYEIRNLFDETVFLDVFWATPFTGSSTFATMPPFNAYGFRSDRVRADVRRGHKRFWGVTEEKTSGGGYLQTVLDQLQTEIGDNLGEQAQATGTDPIFQPVVVGRIQYEPEPGKIAYRLPTNAAEAKYFIASNWVPQTYVTSQNSRKIGRGS